MAKSWADMSKEERSKYDSKKAYNRSTGQGKVKSKDKPKEAVRAEAKERAQANASPAAKSASPSSAASRVAAQNGYKTTGGSKRPEGTTYVPGKGYVKAPSWYRNKDGKIPSVMSSSDYSGGEEKYKQQLAIQQRKEDKRAAERAPKEAAYAAREARRAEAYAYQDSRRDMAEARKSWGNGGGMERKVDQRAHYEHMKNTKGNYGVKGAKAAAVEKLMSTGQKFSALDVEREMGSASTHNMKGLYKAYGGYENYMENHSVGSGNWQSRIPQDQLGTMADADAAQRKFMADKTAYYNSDGFNEKYGNYSWAQKDKANHEAQAKKWNSHFDARAARMKNDPMSHVYGY